MKIATEILEAQKGKFSSINLCYTNFENIDSKVELEIQNKEFTRAFDYTNNLNSVKFDFFLISAIVYGIDNLIDREKYSVDGWAREIEIEFPVYNLNNFIGKEQILEQTLSFLTGDYWSISFKINNVRRIFWRKPKRRNNINRFHKDKVKIASLFSGGLDSLIGVIDELEKLENEEKILFISHFDFKSPGAKKAQENVLKKLLIKYPNRIYWIQTKIALSRINDQQNEIGIDSNYRSRSLLFIGLGVYLANINELIIPENGTISINYPLTPSRVSSLSTRTTHPYVLSKLQEFLINIGINIKITNPYSFLTKGEMVVNNLNTSHSLRDIFIDSISCGKPPRNRNLCKNNHNAKQCGVCMPCIYRRASLHIANLDNDTAYCNDILKAISLDEFPDMKALFSYLKRDISKEQMKTDLVVNGSINLDELDSYAELVFRSRDELLKLFKDKGNTFVKSELGL